MKQFNENWDGISRKNANLTEAKEYILWAVPKGETDQLHAQPIYTQGRSPQDVERVDSEGANDPGQGATAEVHLGAIWRRRQRREAVRN